MTQVINGRGTETRYEYDGQGRETTTKAAYGTSIEARTDTFYDLAGNVTEVRHPAMGRNTQRTDTNSAVTKTEYDKAGNAIKQTDAKNKHTYTTFDARGRRKSTTDRISAVTSFTYTALGQLASLTDAESQTTSYTYDSRGSKLTETYPDHTSGTSPGQRATGPSRSSMATQGALNANRTNWAIRSPTRLTLPGE